MKHIENSETIDRITYELHIEEEDIPVRGNALASGDDALDKQLEDEIIERLSRGDLWAWCTVVVTAKIVLNDQAFEGKDTLGGCCYRDVAEFIQPDGYYDDMRHEALKALADNLEAAVERGKVAKAAIRHIWLMDLPKRAKKFEKRT